MALVEGQGLPESGPGLPRDQAEKMSGEVLFAFELVSKNAALVLIERDRFTKRGARPIASGFGRSSSMAFASNPAHLQRRTGRKADLRNIWR